MILFQSGNSFCNFFQPTRQLYGALQMIRVVVDWSWLIAEAIVQMDGGRKNNILTADQTHLSSALWPVVGREKHARLDRVCVLSATTDHLMNHNRDFPMETASSK